MYKNVLALIIHPEAHMFSWISCQPTHTLMSMKVRCK